MKTVNLHLMGRLGNKCFQWAFGRAYCEKYGYELHTDDWAGEQIFDISCPRITQDMHIRNEDTANGEGDIGLNGYFQMQKCLDLYTRADCKRWFKFRPEILAALRHDGFKTYETVAHIRRGDFIDVNYPLVSLLSYSRALEELGCGPVEFISEEKPHACGSLPYSLGCVPDFYLMTKAKTLFRANSSFSYWAAVLADDEQKIYSPVIDKALGGVSNDCVFQPGNWPRLASFDFTTDLHLRP